MNQKEDDREFGEFGEGGRKGRGGKKQNYRT